MPLNTDPLPRQRTAVTLYVDDYNGVTYEIPQTPLSDVLQNKLLVHDAAVNKKKALKEKRKHIFQGATYDLESGQVYKPEAKNEKLRLRFKEFLLHLRKRKFVSLGQLQSLLGIFSHHCDMHQMSKICLSTGYMLKKKVINGP